MTRHYVHKYTVELDGSDFTQLLMLVMRYGTGTGEGSGTNISLRKSLARAEVRTVHVIDIEPKKPGSEFLK